jgi:6-phospho-beta-glucosidase
MSAAAPRARPLGDDMLVLVREIDAFNRLAIAAANSGRREDALRALRANALVGSRTDPAPLLDALLEANRAFLPAFRGS